MTHTQALWPGCGSRCLLHELVVRDLILDDLEEIVDLLAALVRSQFDFQFLFQGLDEHRLLLESSQIHQRAAHTLIAELTGERLHLGQEAFVDYLAHLLSPLLKITWPSLPPM